MSENSQGVSENPTDESEKSAIRGRNKPMQEFSRYHAFAVEIAVAVIAPTLVGRWLDSKTGKDPWFMIAGLILGAAAAVRSVQRVYGESKRNLENTENPSSEESSE